VLNAQGGYLCEDQDGNHKKGNILRDWQWNKPLKEPIILAVNKYSTLTVKSQQDIMLKFRCESLDLEFDLGEKRTRTDSYLTRVREN